MDRGIGHCQFCGREGWHRRELDGGLSCLDEHGCLQRMRYLADKAMIDNLKRETPLVKLFDKTDPYSASYGGAVHAEIQSRRAEKGED